MTKEQQQKVEKHLKFVFRALPMRKGHDRDRVIKRIFTECEEYISKGINSVADDLDFGSILSLIIEEGCVVNGEMQTDLIEQVYRAFDFKHHWKG